KMIGAVTSNRSSRADRVPHANTSAATIARSDSLIASPDADLAWPPGGSFRQDRLLRHVGLHPARVMRWLARTGKLAMTCMTRAGGVHVRCGARASGDFVLPAPVAAQGRHRGGCAHDPAGPAGHGLCGTSGTAAHYRPVHLHLVPARLCGVRPVADPGAGPGFLAR